jgi:hypothetical protein
VVISVARSSWCAIISSNQPRISWARCFPVIARQAGQAASAASIARRVSSRVSAGTLPTTSPVAGSSTSMTSPLLLATHSPST